MSTAAFIMRRRNKLRPQPPPAPPPPHIQGETSGFLAVQNQSLFEGTLGFARSPPDFEGPPLRHGKSSNLRQAKNGAIGAGHPKAAVASGSGGMTGTRSGASGSGGTRTTGANGSRRIGRTTRPGRAHASVAKRLLLATRFF